MYVCTYVLHGVYIATSYLVIVSCYRKPLICNVAGWWSKELWKKVACPISCRIFPASVYVHYSKESDDPLQTVEVQHQRKASLRQSGEKIEVPFKLKTSSHVMSQASGVYTRYTQLTCIIHTYLHTHSQVHIECSYACIHTRMHKDVPLFT